jgi:hypothetical protein
MSDIALKVGELVGVTDLLRPSEIVYYLNKL